MKIGFIPQKLKRVGEDIRILHSAEKEPVIIAPSDELFQLIDRVSKLELFQVKMTAMALSDEDVCKISGYIPYNYYNVNMRNLFLVFTYRSNDRNCETLYSEWQNSYNNSECNGFMKELLEMDEKFIMMIRNYSMSEPFFGEILDSESIAYRFGIELKNRVFDHAASLKEKLGCFGISDSSRLFHECEMLFYTYCTKDDYLVVDKGKLLTIIKSYNESILKLFLKNFLNCLEVKELYSFSQLAQHLRSVVGDIGTDSYFAFFADVDEEVRDKYNTWINIFKVEEIFGYDERSQFWKQYKYIDVKKYRRSNSVVLEVNNYYISEFLGEANGPIYFFDKEIFDEKVKRYFTSYDNSELRSWLFNNQGYTEGRFVHKKPKGDEYYWCREIHRILITKKMTERIF